MSVEIFTKKEFETRLQSLNLVEMGVLYNQYCYAAPLYPETNTHAFIYSSIGPDGYSRENAEDSIRIVLVQINFETRRMSVISKDVHKWTTRRPGWDERIIKNIQNLRAWYNVCPKCGKVCPVRKVGAATKNKGRIFSVCHIPEHKNYSWKWLTE